MELTVEHQSILDGSQWGCHHVSLPQGRRTRTALRRGEQTEETFTGTKRFDLWLAYLI